MRPNLHIDDVCDVYVNALRWPSEAINGKTYNAGYQNHTIMQLAEIVREVVGKQVEVVTVPTDDHRSYHISSERIRRELGFEPKRTVQDAVRDLNRAFAEGLVPNPMDNKLYYNIKTMQSQASQLKAIG